MNCENCDAELSQNYCPNCGQPSKLKRIDKHYFQHEIEHLFHFERGFLYTVRELVLRPGQTIKEYLHHNRNRLVKPVVFLIVTSLIFTIMAGLLHVETSFFKYNGDGKVTNAKLIFDWIQGHYGYTNIILGVFVSFWVRIFFLKSGFNFFEIIIQWCFVMGIGMLICTLQVLLQAITQINYGQYIGKIVMIYSIWAIGQTFDKGKIINYIKAFFAFILGSSSFILFLVSIGYILDFFTKH